MNTTQIVLISTLGLFSIIGVFMDWPKTDSNTSDFTSPLKFMSLIATIMLIGCLFAAVMTINEMRQPPIKVKYVPVEEKLYRLTIDSSSNN